ncbi:unnamed protein product [Lymnaea stagnalis]|uniref:Arrestin C-terminal-like domain-containing protein n=1 Tax=Lymnaea stagnalis TaxID=6523 RepID=A0AAV2HBX6_LYMST
MGKFTSCVFHIANERHGYWPGEQIEGQVSIELTKDVRVSGVFIFLFGGCQINWHRSDSDIGSETYLNRYISIFGNKPKEAAGHYSLTAGQHVFQFSFTMPSTGLPSSFEGYYGCIRYWLRLNFELPFPKLDKTWTHYISVVSRIPVHTPHGLLPVTARNEKQVSKAFGIGNIGKITLDASTNKSAFCAGETILVELVAQNETSKDMGVVRVTLVQRVTYSTGGFKHVSVPKDLRTIQSTKLLAGQVIRWEGEPLEIDLVPPSSSTPNSSRLLNVQYYVKVVVEVPLGFNLDIRLPITIGTVTPSGAGFVKCSHGFSKFPYCNGNYEVTDYVPSTVCIDVSEGGTERARATRCKSVEGTHDEYRLGDQTMKLLGPLGHLEEVAIDSDQISGSHNIYGATASPNDLTEDAPPSYDEVVGGGEFEETFDHKGSILLIRFPLRDLKSVKSFLIRHRESLKPLDGHMINFSPSPFLRYFHFPWPQLTSAAVFYFGTQEKSEKWLDQLVTAEPLLTSTWSAIIAENSTRIQRPNLQHQTLQITITMFKKLAKSEQQPQSGHDKFYRSSREDLGRLVVYSVKPKFLLGHWSEHNGHYQPKYNVQYQNEAEHLTGKVHDKLSTHTNFEQSEKKAGNLTFPERVELVAPVTRGVSEPVLSGEIRGIQSISINSEYINCEEDTAVTPALGYPTACHVAVDLIEDSMADMNLVPREEEPETVVSVVCYQYPDMTKYLDLAANVFDQELPETLEKAELLGMSVTSVILPGRSLW